MKLLPSTKINTMFRRARGHTRGVGEKASLESRLSVHLGYADQNNLYGFAMCQPVPHSEFCWAEDLTMFTRDFIRNLDGDYGFAFEVDLGYPTHVSADLPRTRSRRNHTTYSPNSW